MERYASSPRSDLLVGRVRSYVSEHGKPYIDALTAAAETLRAWKRDAVTARDELYRLEGMISERVARRGSPAERDLDEYDVYLAGLGIEEQSTRWRRTCAARGEELAAATRKIKFCNTELNLSGEFENVDVTGSTYSARIEVVAMDLDVMDYQPGDEVDVMQAGFIMWLLDPYHDAVGHAIALESGASFEKGNKLSKGGLPDLGMPGPGVFWIGEVKYSTPWSIRQGRGQLAGYAAQNKGGLRAEPHWFISGFRLIAVGPIFIQYGADPTVEGLHTYQVVAGWTIPDLIDNRHRARARQYEPVTAARAEELGFDDVFEPVEGFVPNPATIEVATSDSGGGGGGGGIPVPDFSSVDPTPYVATAAGGMLAVGAAVIWGLLD